MDGAPPPEDVSPAMAEPAGEGAEMEASAAGEEGHRGIERSASQTLSSEDVVEISKFNAGKVSPAGWDTLERCSMPIASFAGTHREAHRSE
jgi:hypothetical protein